MKINLKSAVYHLTMFFFRFLFPIKRNRVFFISFGGRAYSDNPKAISEKLYSMLGNDIEIIWALNHDVNTNGLPNYIKIVENNTLKMLYYLSTSKVWVANFGLRKGTYKRSNQYYIQTWHGDRGFKKCLCDVPYNNQWLFESKNADVILSGSDFSIPVFRSAFRYKGEILSTGCPRNDIFFIDNTQLCKKLRSRYGLNINDKVVMYAPTFRNEISSNGQDVTLNLEQVGNILDRVTNQHWKIFLRAHAHHSRLGFDMEKNNKMIDVTNYPDMNELLQITDILITDYSSAAGDFVLSGKLLVLFHDDIKSYSSNDRDFYFDMNTTPFFRFSNNQEIFDFFEKYNSINSKQNCKEVLDFYKTHEDGHASEKVCNLIIKNL